MSGIVLHSPGKSAECVVLGIPRMEWNIQSHQLMSSNLTNKRQQQQHYAARGQVCELGNS
jgi:hypothetical protein